MGEFSEVEVYYDTLERKKRAASKDSGLSLPNSTTSEVASGIQTQASFASKVSIPESNASNGFASRLSEASNHSFGVNKISGVSLTPDANDPSGANLIEASHHQPQRRPKSLISTSALSYPANLKPSLADANSKRRSSPGDVSIPGLDTASQLRRPGTRPPAGNVPQSLTSTYSKLAPSAAPSVKKKFQGNVLPPRYSKALGEQYHTSASPKMSREVPDVPTSSPHGGKFGSRPGSLKSSMTAATEGIAQGEKAMSELSGKLLSPTNDIPVSSSKQSRISDQGRGKETTHKNDLAGIFDSDTLPVSKKKDDQRGKEPLPSVLRSSHANSKLVSDGKQPKKSKISLFGRQKDGRSKTSVDNQRSPQRQQSQLPHPPQPHPPQQRPTQHQQLPPYPQSSMAAADNGHHGPHLQLRPQATHSHGFPQPLRATHIAGLGNQAAGERRDSSHLARSGGGGIERPPVIGKEKTTSSFPGRLGSPPKKSYKSSADTSLPMYSGSRGEERTTQQQARHPRLQQMSGIPMRATKSAQQPSIPVSEDAPITSYPRFQPSTVRMRSSSNGQVMKITPEQPQQQQQQQQQPSLNFSRPVVARPGVKAGSGATAPSLRAPQGRTGGGAAFMKAGGYGGTVENVAGTTKGIMVGSLV